MKELCKGKSKKLNITISVYEESNSKAEKDFLKALVDGIVDSFIEKKEEKTT